MAKADIPVQVNIPVDDVIEYLKNNGTLVAVVRCKDCKHRDPEDQICRGRGWPVQAVPDDGFCDKGDIKKKVPVTETCGECPDFNNGDCCICCHPPVSADQTPPWWCPKKEVTE